MSPVGHNFLEFIDSLKERKQLLKDAKVAARNGYSEPRMLTLTPQKGSREKVLSQFYRLRDPETYEHIGFVISGRYMTQWIEETKKAKDTVSMIGHVLKEKIKESKYEMIDTIEMVCKTHCPDYKQHGKGGCIGLETVRKLVDNDGLLEKLSKLTPAERTVANFTKEGLHLKDIAKTLNISVSTVQKHRTSIRKKMGINDASVSLYEYFQIV
jgi:DNA-binding CsgD family transcriptional regulator